MAVGISFESNIREWTASLDDVAKRQLPFAIALALTDTARYDVKPAIERRMIAAFDKPTPFTQRGVAHFPAHKATLAARVFIKDVQAKYLALEETGGVRKPERRALVVPAGQSTNAYGNLPRNTLKKLLARPDTFSGRINGTAGIWQRTRKGVKLLIAWRDSTSYQPRFAFRETAQAAAELAFPRRFEAAFSKALATAR